MRDLLDRYSGQRLATAVYRADFRERFWAIAEHDFWKLERQQSFAEPGDESWEAFDAGDWPRALRLIEEQRAALVDEGRRMASLGLTSYRMRVLELPLTPYLQWELHLLRLAAECSDRVRVVDVDAVKPFEDDGVLPEVVTLGADVTYEVLYDDAGVLCGGVRFLDRDLTSACREFIQQLYASGEDMGAFFDREVAGLPAPPGGGGDRSR